MSDLFRFDLRLLERHIRGGMINDREYQSFLRDLPDLEGKCEESSLEDLIPQKVLTKLMGKEPNDRES